MSLIRVGGVAPGMAEGGRGRSEARKLQVTGGSTFIVSLPKPWVTRHRLASGDVVQVREGAGGVLEVSPQEGPRARRSRLVLRVEEGGAGEKLLLQEGEVVAGGLGDASLDAAAAVEAGRLLAQGLSRTVEIPTPRGAATVFIESFVHQLSEQTFFTLKYNFLLNVYRNCERVLSE